MASILMGFINSMESVEGTARIEISLQVQAFMTSYVFNKFSGFIIKM